MASIDLRHVRSLTDFLRNHREHVERLRETESPEVLTINGRAELVVQTAESYQALIDRLEHAENVAGLRKAYGQFRAGATHDLSASTNDLREKHGL